MAPKEYTEPEQVTCTCTIETPLGMMTAAAEETFLTGLWFIGQKHYPMEVSDWETRPDIEVFRWLKLYLKCYFGGKVGNHDFPLAPRGSRQQLEVWEALRTVPYGRTVRPEALLRDVIRQSGCETLTSQGLQAAIERTPISILIPSHRILRSVGSLADYPGGPQRKEALLGVEGVLSVGNVLRHSSSRAVQELTGWRYGKL
ncbi:methylated-DNA--[protein]-cysteine S-methyltransferase [Geomonas sp. RF6]|uniref:methylated-DNA--[protein]-cysteine S-methyltransferase n=1 Tax=Geomonas sp. RF6 TaxID=2897342 RepID=UPI001E42F528|nr:methylated-DNA--[protein]-cysteine S-methyltransferase [Geomonas sp. RF6]UFS69502.1 methylated-DNA--[protein]-cysteine S-methyltransferase [Geomonas sp. RF6]